MKRTIVLSAAVLLVFAVAAWGQMGGPMGGGQQQQQACPGCMMGPGMGMGGMGMGMGPGMGQGMMGGMGMGQGMMYSPQGKKFLDETKELRKELWMKQFEYMEAQRDPAITPEAMMKLQKEIKELNIKLYEKAPVGMGW